MAKSEPSLTEILVLVVLLFVVFGFAIFVLAENP